MTKALQYYHQNEVVQNELYSTLVTEITTTKDDYHSIWPNLYPGKSLTNKIGSASGVEFLNNQRMVTVYGDVIQQKDGSQIKKAAGIQCTKQGQKMRPDGSMQISSPCTYEFNWEDRAELDFIADLDKAQDKIKYNFPNNPNKEALERRKHTLELKKFAAQRASTGAELIVIRELTGMPTAFKENDLKSAAWTMAFSQIGKSHKHQQAEAHAKIENIRNGGQIAIGVESAAVELTGGSAGFANDFERPTTPADNQPDTIEPETTHPDPTEGKSPDQINYEALLNDTRVDQGMQDYYNGILNSPDGQAAPENFYKWAVGDIKSSLGAA